MDKPEMTEEERGVIIKVATLAVATLIFTRSETIEPGRAFSRAVAFVEFAVGAGFDPKALMTI